MGKLAELLAKEVEARKTLEKKLEQSRKTPGGYVLDDDDLKAIDLTLSAIPLPDPPPPE